MTRSFIRLGQKVDKGSPLFEISSPDFFETGKVYYQAKQEMELASKNLCREQDLYAHKVSAQKEVEEAEVNYELKKKDYENALAALKVFQTHDPRWGRIAEGFGEDPLLVSQMGVAAIKGFQGSSLNHPTSIAACAKHFAGYGASEGGRDYNSTYITERQFRNLYFRPFEAAVNAGAATLMTAFNDNDGIPSSANPFLLKDVLRNEWNYRGTVVSDWASVSEMIRHGFCEDEKEAALKATNAGTDIEMVSETYIKHLPQLIKEGKVSMETIDNAVPAFVAFSAASFSSSQNPWRIISETDAQSDTTVPR